MFIGNGSLYYRPPGFWSAFQQYDDIRKEMESGSYCGETSWHAGVN